MWWSSMTGKLEQAKGLDPAVDAVTTVVDRVLASSSVKDALHGRWLGHQLHPLLVALPIGMFSSALVLDLLGGEQSRPAARRLVGAGVLAVAPTAAAGLADWSELGAFRRPRRVGLVHAGANVVASAFFGASWVARRGGHHSVGTNLALMGTAGLGVGGYLGGHLSYSEGVGVNRNADESKKPVDWTDAAAVDDVGEGQLHRVDVDGQQVLLTRRNGEFSAVGATCSHYGAPLQEGELDDGCVVCPWHGSRFRFSDGSVDRGPATVPQLAYDVRSVGHRLQIRVSA